MTQAENTVSVSVAVVDMEPKMEVVLLPGAKIPYYAHPGDAGMDLCSNEEGVVTLSAAERGGPIGFFPLGFDLSESRAVKIHTGVKVAIPEGFMGFIVPRSGLGSKGITVSNSPGTIDSGYRGELIVSMINHSNVGFDITPGDRIAQLVIVPVASAKMSFVEEFSTETSRGEGGFGSTGVS